MNILKTIIKSPIIAYTSVISPLTVPSCRFMPTCSAYSLEAIEKHGGIKGLFLSAKRILKCHPWHKCSAYDPVPERFDW